MGLIIKKILVVLLISFLFFTCSENKESIQGKYLVDELGNKVYLKSKPLRIISMAPNITEIIYAINAQSMLVGRTSFCNYPEDVKEIPVVGDLIKLNFEKVVELKPDIVFMTVEGNTKETFDKLKTLGIQVFVINPRNIDGIINSILNIANVLNKRDTANGLVNLIRMKINRIDTQNLKEQHAMFVVSLNPLMIAGKNTFINDIMKRAKLKNIAPDAISSYPIISREEVLRKNPDWIILPDGYSLKEVLENYVEWRNINAVKKGKIIFVDPDLFFRPGPRFIDAVEFLVDKINKSPTKKNHI